MDIDKVKRKIKRLLEQGYELKNVHEGDIDMMVIDKIKIYKQKIDCHFYYYINIIDCNVSVSVSVFDELINVFTDFYTKTYRVTECDLYLNN